MQWVFDKGQMFEGSTSHLTLVSSGADDVMTIPNDELIALALRELRDARAGARARQRFMRAFVVRERRATFSLAPGQPARPGTRTNVERLFLAGDWIDTGLPATIEGAAVSGRRAAEAIVMNSVVVHYQEIALKGRNRPWFIGRLVRNIRTATSDLDVQRVISKMGRIEIVLGSADAWEPVADRLRRVFGIANFSRAALVPLDVDVIAKAILAGSRRSARSRRSACRRARADKRFPLTSPQIEREVGGRIKDAQGMDGESGQSGVHDSRRSADGRGVLLLRKGGRARRHAHRCQRPRGRAVVGRHRFAGGGVSADEARVPRHPCALSQLSDSVASIAGEGARADARC